jgi:hypothetical protein
VPECTSSVCLSMFEKFFWKLIESKERVPTFFFLFIRRFFTCV